MIVVMRFIRFILAALAVVIVSSCESILGNVLEGVGLVDPEDVEDFTFSYRVDVSEGRYVMFRDSVQFAQSPERLDETDRFNTVYLDREYVCAIDTKPEDASLVGVSVVSSDPSILKVKAGATPLDYKLEVLGVGECSITVRIGDNKGIYDKVYHMRAMAKLGLELGLNDKGSKILYRVTEMPSNVNTALCIVTDSVTMHVACHFIDDEKKIDRIERRVHSFERNSRYDVFCEKFKRTLSNQSDFVRNLEKEYLMGTEAVETEDGIKYEERKCYWYVEQIECGCSFVADDPYYIFDCSIDKDSMDSSNPDYFVLSMIDNMTFGEKKEVSDELNQKTEELAGKGVNLDDVLNYSDSEMDEFINGLNDFYNN
jgi:hypothetical protein